jgi:hypothetical protein
MLGTVGNRDSTVVESVDEKLFSEEKLSEKIPEKNTGYRPGGAEVHACRGCRRRDVEGPKSIRATLGPCEEGRRGVSGGKGDRSGGKKGGPVSPDKGTDGPKVVGKMGIGNNVGEERGAERERQGTTGGSGQGRAVRL